MAVTPLNIIYSWFETGDYPTQEQFQATWQSFWHKSETIPMSQIGGLDRALNNYVITSTFNSHLNDENAHGVNLKANADASNISSFVKDWKKALGIEFENYVLSSELKPIAFSGFLQDAEEIKNAVFHSADNSRRIWINGSNNINENAIMYDAVISGWNVLPNLAGKQESENHYSSRYIVSGTDIFPNFKGNSDYRPAHPAHDSLVAYGSILGYGVEDGTNLTIVGTANMHGNDIPYWDSVTIMGKGNTNGKGSFGENSKRIAVGSNGFNLRNMVEGVVVVGNENWFGDIHSSTIIGTSTKLYRYAFNSVVIGFENQNYNGATDTILDNDVIIGNGLNKNPLRHKPTHNLLIGSQTGYGNGGFNSDYRPLIEGNFATNEEMLNINGDLSVTNRENNEYCSHSDNIIEVTNLNDWRQTGDFTFQALGTSSLQLNELPAGRTYLFRISPVNGDFQVGTWGFHIDNATGVTDDSGNSGSWVGGLYSFSTTAPTFFTLNCTDADGGELFVELYEIDSDGVVEPSFKVIGVGDRPTFELRTGPAGSENVFLGKLSGSKNLNSERNAVVGSQSLSKCTVGHNNAAIGYGTMKNGLSVSRSVAVGSCALENFDAGHSNAVGYRSQQNNVSAQKNNSFGNETLKDCTSGDENSVFGHSTFYQFNSGAGNIAFGAFAGLGLSSGDDNVYLGTRNTPGAANVNNEIVIGAKASGNGSNTATIGDENVTELFIGGNGAGIVLSSPDGTKRMKISIENSGRLICTDF